MIPFFQYNYFLVGPLTIQVWGLFVAGGVLAAVFFGTNLVKKYLLSEDAFLDAAVWVLFSALFFARVFHILFYELEFYVAHPEELIKFWHGGASSLGGFFGAFFALFIFKSIRRFSLKELWPYLDVMTVSLWLGWGIGRLGCFMIHDHPGILSNFFLAVKFPGGSRLDLGLMESLLAFIIFAIYFVNFKWFIKKSWGLVTIFSVMTYAAGRFILDFFRSTDLAFSDVRYAFLTPAQWGMVVIIISLTLVLFSAKIRRLLAKKSEDQL